MKKKKKNTHKIAPTHTHKKTSLFLTTVTGYFIMRHLKNYDTKTYNPESTPHSKSYLCLF